jgi:hypothetical protein
MGKLKFQEVIGQRSKAKGENYHYLFGVFHTRHQCAKL